MTRLVEQYVVLTLICDECGARAQMHSKNEIPEGWMESGGKALYTRSALCPHCKSVNYGNHGQIVFEVPA